MIQEESVLGSIKEAIVIVILLGVLYAGVYIWKVGIEGVLKKVSRAVISTVKSIIGIRNSALGVGGSSSGSDSSSDGSSSSSGGGGNPVTAIVGATVGATVGAIGSVFGL